MDYRLDLYRGTNGEAKDVFRARMRSYCAGGQWDNFAWFTRAPMNFDPVIEYLPPVSMVGLRREKIRVVEIRIDKPSGICRQIRVSGNSTFPKFE